MKKNLPNNIFASWISRIFSPAIFLPSIFLIFLFKQHLSFNSIINSLFYFLFIGIIPIFTFYFWLYQSKQISDLDISKREQRIKFNLPVIIYSFVMLFFIQKYIPQSIFQFLWMIWVLVLIMSVITLFWKISGHMIAVTICSLILFNYYSWGIFFLVLAIPAVGWSRYYLKHHNLAQILGGTLLSTGVFFLGKYLGWI